MKDKKPLKEILKDYALKTPRGDIRYGIGCAWLGFEEHYEENVAGYVSTLETAYAYGFRYYDTSEAYRKSEFTVGQFIRGIPRDSIFLATKSRVPYEDDPGKAAGHVRDNLYRSLDRMHTDHLDLFQLHDVLTLSHILAEDGVLKFLLEARKQGIIRYFGLAARPHELLEMAARQGEFDSILTFCDYTPVNQSAERIIQLAGDLNLGVINASPLCSGWLVGKEPVSKRVVDNPEVARFRKQSAIYIDFCRKHHVSPLAAALQYPLGNENIGITLTGPSSPDEVRTSAEALNMQIPASFWTDWEKEGMEICTI